MIAARDDDRTVVIVVASAMAIAESDRHRAVASVIVIGERDDHRTLAIVVASAMAIDVAVVAQVAQALVIDGSVFLQ